MTKVCKDLTTRNRSSKQGKDGSGFAVSGGSGVGCLDTPEQGRIRERTPLEKRAKRVYYGKGLARMLVNAARGPLLGKAYSRTLNQCQSLLLQEDGKLTTYYCGYRWCPCCSAIKTARAWGAYGEEVQSWANEGKCFLVTLTVPNCSFGNLRNVVRGMHKNFSTITNTLQKRYGKGSVKMIRATEVSYNEETNQAHPHMHLLVYSREMSVEVVKLWMKRNPEASILAQDIRKGDKNSIAEVFKYCQKLSSDKRDESGQRKLIPPQILDCIFTSLRSLRLWAAAGIRAANGDDKAIDDTAEIEVDTGTVATTRVDERILWEWSQTFATWIDYNTGEVLTPGYEPSRTSKRFVSMMDAVSVELEGINGCEAQTRYKT